MKPESVTLRTKSERMGSLDIGRSMPVAIGGFSAYGTIESISRQPIDKSPNGVIYEYVIDIQLADD